MYSIGEIARITGITAFTLRYYEKIGVIPKPVRLGGSRRYSGEDLRYIRFIHGLKQTGMSLEDIAAFTADGCLLALNQEEKSLDSVLHKRTEILERHIDQLEQQIKRLEAVKALASEKRAYYSALLERQFHQG